ncbi:MAG TPA: nitrite reductase small subunit NirD [Porticoccaceae bacterium]|nr:nitrite reductase small subunit NirD [Porticoccaceae bacterium]
MKALKANQWETVCTLTDLVENAGVCALVNGQQVAIFYLPTENPRIYAIGNWDPIGKANVLSRGIVGDLKGELVVASPLYKQHFSLVTGKCLEDDSVAVPVYEVVLDGDTLLVEV